VVDLFAQARIAGQALTATYRLRSRDGSYRWHEARVAPLRTGAGDVRLWVGTATDVEEHRLAGEERRYLVQATSVLGASLDLERTLADVARLVVPVLADWCSIDLVGDEREGVELERAAVAHVDPSKVKLAWDLWKLVRPKPSDVHGAYAVMRSRTAELLHVTDEMLVAAIADPQVWRSSRASSAPRRAGACLKRRSRRSGSRRSRRRTTSMRSRPCSRRAAASMARSAGSSRSRR